MDSTRELIKVLQDADAPREFIDRARRGDFHDFKSQSATPINDLIAVCHKYGLNEIAQKAMEGEFDATQEEADEWTKSDEYKEIISRLAKGK